VHSYGPGLPMQWHVRIESGRGDSIAEKYCPKFLQLGRCPQGRTRACLWLNVKNSHWILANAHIDIHSTHINDAIHA